MEVIVAGDAAQAAYDVIAAAVREKPALVLALPTGETPKPLYRKLAALDLSQCTTFNLDEYVGLAPDDPRSFHHYMREHFTSSVRARHLPDGNARDLAAECERYEAAIAAAGGIDLCVLGLGSNGHIAFNEPGSAQTSRTRVVALHDRPAPTAITVGVATILAARQCLLVATGEAKAEATRAMIEGPVSAAVPASFLRLHPRALVVLDAAAAQALA